MNTTQFEVAAQWWADRLTNCRHSGLSEAERRDRSNDGYALTEMMMTVNRPRVTPAQVDKFKAALVAKLEAADKWTRATIAVDYGPDPILTDALTEAGIDSSMGTLPIKTVMWISDDGSVSVRYGYGADTQELRAADSQEVPHV